MKRILLTLFFVFCVLALQVQGQNFSQHWGEKAFETSFSKTSTGEYLVSFIINNVDVVDENHDGTMYNKIKFASSTVTTKEGWAELPFVSAAIQLPANKNVKIIRIDPADVIEFTVTNPILPSRGVFYRNQDPEEIPYKIAEESIVDEFYPSVKEDLVTMERPFILRDVRGTSLHFYPFHYNPVTKIVRFYRKISVVLKEDDSEVINPLAENSVGPCREAVAMYKSIFINYEDYRKSLSQVEKGDILVLTTAKYEKAIEPYIVWKKEMGFNVTKTIVLTGTNVTSVIQEAYNENKNLMYVQLVGDWEDIQCNTLETIDGDVPMDPTLGCVAGDDVFFDIAIGRFTCNNEEELAIQVNKTINYEKNPNMDADWRETYIAAGGTTGSSDGDDMEADNVHIGRIYTERLQPFTYKTIKENYGYFASTSDFTASINAGGSTIAYCGHGSATDILSPKFNVTNVYGLTNGDRLPFIVAAACKVGSFHLTADCFGEAWLKNEKGGAVVTLMSSASQAWQSPQRAQDYFYDILVGGFDYDQYEGQNGISTTEQRTRWGSLVVNALNLAFTEQQYQSDRHSFNTWITFGDASLQLRTKQPDTLSIKNVDFVEGKPFTATILAGEKPVENALVCLSQDGKYVSGYTNAEGEITLENKFFAGKILLVVTAFNTNTIYQNIDCAEGASPEITFQNCFPGVINSGETSTLTLAMRNDGEASTTDYTNVTISTEDPLITIVDGYGKAGLMDNSGGTATMEDEFKVAVANGVPTGYLANIQWTASIGNKKWSGSFQICINNSSCSAPTGVRTSVKGTNVTVSWDAEYTMKPVTMVENAEGHSSGTINSAGSMGWSYIDGDGAKTGVLPTALLKKTSSKMAFIVVNDDNMISLVGVNAHSGNQYFGCPVAMPKSLFRSGNNDDWMITPRLNFDAPITFSFYACSYCSLLAKEKFYVAYSTSGKNASDFINVTGAITTGTSWKQYSYTVPANAKYIAIHCVSSNQYMLCVDDITISSYVKEPESYNVYCNQQLVASNVTEGSYIANVSSGDYCYSVSHNCADGTESLASEPACVKVQLATYNNQNDCFQFCPSPETVFTVPYKNNIGLSWEKIDEAVYYMIYRNNVPIATTSLNYYIDENVNMNSSYIYRVKTVCSDFVTKRGTVDEGTTIIADFEPRNITVFPNPASNVLNVKGDDIKEISIFSAIGSLVRKVVPTEQTTQIPVNDLGSGIYFVRINTSNNLYTEKVIIRN